MDENSKYTRELLTEGQELARGKWKWLVKGIQDDYMQTVVASLAENQLREGGNLIGETLGQQSQNLNEATLSTNIYGVNQILLPVIRRIYPALMANNWVAIQPMLSPVSLIFYLRYFYTNAKSNTAAGSEFLKVPLTGELGVDPYYSSARNVVTDTTAAAVSTKVNAASASGNRGFKNLTPVNSSVFARAFTGNTLIAEVQFQGVYGTATTIPATAIQGGSVSSWAGLSYNSATKDVTLTTLSGADKYEVEWEYDQEQAGDYADGDGIPEMDVRIKTDAVQARQRKLKTQWTLEASEDLKVLHNVDAEKELVNLMASEILLEIDREILKELITNAYHRATHNWTDDTGNNASGNIIDRNQSLAMRITQLSSEIHRTTRVSGANWMVTSPLIAAKLQEVRGYVPVPPGGDNTMTAYGIQAAGALPGSEMRVYKDPLFPQDLILMGYKGKSFIDSGYFYAPYVPIKTTPIIYDPKTLQPRRGMITRYATKIVDGGEFFYGTIRVTNLTA